MKEFRRLWVALLVLAILAPAGIYLPAVLKGGPAWGEWGLEEIRRMIGYEPEGLKRTAEGWKAPMPDYAPAGRGDAPLPRRALSYILSALIGLALCGGAAWLLARRLSAGKRRRNGVGK